MASTSRLPELEDLPSWQAFSTALIESKRTKQISRFQNPVAKRTDSEGHRVWDYELVFLQGKRPRQLYRTSEVSLSFEKSMFVCPLVGLQEIFRRSLSHNTSLTHDWSGRGWLKNLTFPHQQELQKLPCQVARILGCERTGETPVPNGLEKLRFPLSQPGRGQAKVEKHDRALP